jgi:hypothetical protein
MKRLIQFRPYHRKDPGFGTFPAGLLFKRSVILLGEHGEEGTIGFILNKQPIFS